MTTTPFDPSVYDTASGRRLKRECGPCEAGAELTLIPEVLYFGYVPPLAVSDWQPFLIKNTGTVTVGVEALIVDGEFEIGENNPMVLAPGEIATYSIRFAPQGNGLRDGDIIVHAATAGEQPVVKLIGIGGDLATIATDTTWAYRYGAFAVEDIKSEEILLDYHVTTAHRLQSNLAGCKFSVGTPPQANFTLTLLKNNIEVATIVIHTDGTYTATTGLGVSIHVPVNSIMTLKAQTTVDVDIARLRATFVGVI